jgi:hypothetical protein
VTCEHHKYSGEVMTKSSITLQMIVCLLVSNKEATCQQIGHVARGGVAERERYGMQSPRGGRERGSERCVASWLSSQVPASGCQP